MVYSATITTKKTLVEFRPHRGLFLFMRLREDWFADHPDKRF